MFKYLIVAALIMCVVADDDDHHAETKLWKNEIGHHGWSSEIETSNHIRQAAHGDEHGNIEGDFAWVDPHGEKVEVKYIADKYGYQPDILPKAIIESIELAKANPHHEEDDHHHKH